MQHNQSFSLNSRISERTAWTSSKGLCSAGVFHRRYGSCWIRQPQGLEQPRQQTAEMLSGVEAGCGEVFGVEKPEALTRGDL